MTRILKGDTSAPISVTLATGIDMTGKTVELEYQGVKRSFTGVSAGGTVTFSFTASETAKMALGVRPVSIRLKWGQNVTTISNAEVRIGVTDKASEVRSANAAVVGATAVGALFGVEDLPDQWTEADLVEKIREILRRGGAFATTAATLLALCLSAYGASVSTARKDAVYNDQQIVTNVSFAGLATTEYVDGISNALAGASAETPNYLAVSNAAMSALKSKSPVYEQTGAEISWNDARLEMSNVRLYAGSGLEVSTFEGIQAQSTTLPSYLANGTWNTADDPFVTESDLPTTPESVGAAPASITNTVNAWTTYWDGDDVRLTVTNYFGSIDRPRLYLEQKISDGGTNYFRTVWDETTRLEHIWNQVVSNKNEIAEKADRAWGFYDSHTGTYSPDGFTQISSSNVLIAAGMSYQKTVTTGGCAVWVLRATEPTSISGTGTNGFFRIEDGDGNALFEIVKGDKRTVGATATALSMGSGSVMTINYATVSQDHPTLSLSASLSEATWLAEDACSSLASVSWSGSSGAWIATVTPAAGRSSLFVKATYQAGGETYIKNTAPLGFDRVYIGGSYYRVSVETVNGKKLMVLTDE